MSFTNGNERPRFLSIKDSKEHKVTAAPLLPHMQRLNFQHTYHSIEKKISQRNVNESMTA